MDTQNTTDVELRTRGSVKYDSDNWVNGPIELVWTIQDGKRQLKALIIEGNVGTLTLTVDSEKSSFPSNICAYGYNTGRSEMQLDLTMLRGILSDPLYGQSGFTILV